MVCTNNENDDDTIADREPGNIILPGIELWLGEPGKIHCLRLCSLTVGKANGWIKGQGFDKISALTEI